MREAITAGSGAAMAIVACLGQEAHLASQVGLLGTFILRKGGDPELEPEVSRDLRWWRDDRDLAACVAAAVAPRIRPWLIDGSEVVADGQLRIDSERPVRQTGLPVEDAAGEADLQGDQFERDSLVRRDLADPDDALQPAFLGLDEPASDPGIHLSIRCRATGYYANDRVADLVQADVHGFEHASGDTLALADEAEEQMLGADVAMAEPSGLVDRQLDDAFGAWGQPDFATNGSVAPSDDELDGRPDLRQL